VPKLPLEVCSDCFRNGSVTGHWPKTSANGSCLKSLIGGSWAWLIVSEGGPEALGAIGPMMAVGGIHIILGPMAILYAFKSRQFKSKKYIYIYFYFVFYFLTTIVILHREAIVYSVLLFVVVITPLLFCVIASLIGDAKKQ